jgi:hypothetical protein
MKALKLLLGTFVLVMLVVVIHAINWDTDAPRTLTLQETQQRTKDAEDQYRAVMGAESLRAAMRNPDSFKLKSAGLTSAGAVCYQYRAQNGFGGMNLEYAVLAPGATSINTNLSVWNRQCANKPIHDQTWAVNTRMGLK